MGRLSAILLIGLLAAGGSLAAEPEVRNLSLRATLQIGGTTTLTVDGDGLLPNPRLHLPFPAKAVLKSLATDKQAVFDVTLGEDVVPGYHHLRPCQR